MNSPVHNFNKVHSLYNAFMQVAGIYRSGDLLDLLALRGHERVLDVGAGTGHYALALAQRCNQVHALEPNVKMLQHIPAHPRIIPHCLALGDHSFLPESFDVVVLTDVLHHMQDHPAVLQECARLLRPGGKIVLYEFEPTRRRVRILGWLEGLLFGSVQYRTLLEMRKLLGECGFALPVERTYAASYMLCVTRVV